MRRLQADPSVLGPDFPQLSLRHGSLGQTLILCIASRDSGMGMGCGQDVRTGRELAHDIHNDNDKYVKIFVAKLDMHCITIKVCTDRHKIKQDLHCSLPVYLSIMQ